MTDTVPLILSADSVGKETRSKVDRPHVAVVYADAAGHLTQPGRPLGRMEARRFRTRYEIDLGDHRRKAQLDSSPLPSQGDAYFFHSTVDIGFRVTDPEAVVRRNVTDALPVVYGYLLSEFRPVTRRFKIQEAEQAESALNALFRNPVQLDEGIMIYRCTVQLLPDPAAQQHLRTLVAADRALAEGEARRKAQEAEARYEHAKAGEAQRSRLEMEKRERDALASLPFDIEGLIRIHLSKHPDQSAYAVELLNRHLEAQVTQRTLDDKRSQELLRYMIEQGMIQAIDMERLRDQTLGHVQQIASRGRPAELPAASWDEPLPPGPVLSLAAEPEAAGELPADTGSPADTARTVPVYLVIDESPADPDYFAALNDGIRTLLTDLAAHPGIIRAMRLAVLGYADDVIARMPLNVISADSYIPELISRAGSCLGAVFDYLHGHITDDVARLKSQGLTVGRPTVYLLCAATPGDSPAWEAPFSRLTDRAGFPAAPNIVACGIGPTVPDVITRVAARTQSRGWLAAADMPLSEAASRYVAFVRQTIAVLGRAHVTGSADATAESPAGFRPVNS